MTLPRRLTPDEGEAKRRAGRFEEFRRLSRLNENIGKTDQEIWEIAGMKRFLIYLFLFPAIATVSLYAVLYILTGAVVDSLSGPAFLLPRVYWARSRGRFGGLFGR